MPFLHELLNVFLGGGFWDTSFKVEGNSHGTLATENVDSVDFAVALLFELLAVEFYLGWVVCD